MQRRLRDFQKKRIATAMPLRKGVSPADVVAQIESALQNFWRASDAEARIENIELQDGMLVLTRRRYPSKGRPAEKPLRAYVTAIVKIYEQSTGRRIGRMVDAYAYDHREKSHPFLAVCMRAAGKRYPRRIIRDVLGDVHPKEPQQKKGQLKNRCPSYLEQ